MAGKPGFCTLVIGCAGISSFLSPSKEWILRAELLPHASESVFFGKFESIM